MIGNFCIIFFLIFRQKNKKSPCVANGLDELYLLLPATYCKIMFGGNIENSDYDVFVIASAGLMKLDQLCSITR